MKISTKINQAINKVANLSNGSAAEPARPNRMQVGRTYYDRLRQPSEVQVLPFTAVGVIEVGDIKFPVNIKFVDYEVSVQPETNNFVFTTRYADGGRVEAYFSSTHETTMSSPSYVVIHCANGSRIIFREPSGDRPCEPLEHIPSHGYCGGNVYWDA